MKDRQSKQVILELSKEKAAKIVKEEPEQTADMLVALTKTVNVLVRKVDELSLKEELKRALNLNWLCYDCFGHL